MESLLHGFNVLATRRPERLAPLAGRLEKGPAYGGAIVASPTDADWPTFPQIYVKGELIGGHDILMDMYQKGELQPLLQDALQKEVN